MIRFIAPLYRKFPKNQEIMPMPKAAEIFRHLPTSTNLDKPPFDLRNRIEALLSRSNKYANPPKDFIAIGLILFAIDKIYNKMQEVYKPSRSQVLDETDDAKNWLAQSMPVVYPSTDNSVSRLCTKSSVDITRDELAEEVVSNMIRRLKVSFFGKTCLDVGCRSGENAIAMAKAGAKVIGIDPDDSEFETAQIKGMTGRQLIKATLQEYHTQFPDQRFDIVTLFLWNIDFLEREEIGSALAQIIKPEGTVIISYYDEEYNSIHSSVPNLMGKFFGKVEKFILPGWNRYMLKCSSPKIDSLCM